MEAERNVEVDELDLVEEFRTLDENGDDISMTERLGAFGAPAGHPEGLEADIGEVSYCIPFHRSWVHSSGSLRSCRCWSTDAYVQPFY